MIFTWRWSSPYCRVLQALWGDELKIGCEVDVNRASVPGEGNWATETITALRKNPDRVKVSANVFLVITKRSLTVRGIRCSGKFCQTRRIVDGKADERWFNVAVVRPPHMITVSHQFIRIRVCGSEHFDERRRRS